MNINDEVTPKILEELGWSQEQHPCTTCNLGIVDNYLLQKDGTTKKVKEVCPCCNGIYWDCPTE